jgi:hypothetical protein
MDPSIPFPSNPIQSPNLMPRNHKAYDFLKKCYDWLGEENPSSEQVVLFWFVAYDSPDRITYAEGRCDRHAIENWPGLALRCQGVAYFNYLRHQFGSESKAFDPSRTSTAEITIRFAPGNIVLDTMVHEIEPEAIAGASVSSPNFEPRYNVKKDKVITAIFYGLEPIPESLPDKAADYIDDKAHYSRSVHTLSLQPDTTPKVLKPQEPPRSTLPHPAPPMRETPQRSAR